MIKYVLLIVVKSSFCGIVQHTTSLKSMVGVFEHAYGYVI